MHDEWWSFVQDLIIDASFPATPHTPRVHRVTEINGVKIKTQCFLTQIPVASVLIIEGLPASM